MPRYCYCWNANAALLLLLERECRATATAGTRMPRYTATAGTRLPRYCYCYTATLLHRTRKPRYYHYTTAIYCYARNAKAAPLLQNNPQPFEFLKTPQRIVCEFKMYMHTPRNPPRRKRCANIRRITTYPWSQGAHREVLAVATSKSETTAHRSTLNWKPMNWPSPAGSPWPSPPGSPWQSQRVAWQRSVWHSTRSPP